MVDEQVSESCYPFDYQRGKLNFSGISEKNDVNIVNFLVAPLRAMRMHRTNEKRL